MLAHFVGRHRLTKPELAELRALLDEAAETNNQQPGNRSWKR
jgi:hypothetical protein